jgi:hypothetical protein
VDTFICFSWLKGWLVQSELFRMALRYIINLSVSAFGNILVFAFVKLDEAHQIVA